jgi:hypothetical protein
VTIQWEHDGAESPQFRFLIDGVVVKTWAPTEVAKSTVANSVGDFTFSAPFAPGFTKGEHTVQVDAFNSLGNNTSDPLNIIVGTAPKKPRNTSVTVIIQIK